MTWWVPFAGSNRKAWFWFRKTAVRLRGPLSSVTANGLIAATVPSHETKGEGMKAAACVIALSLAVLVLPRQAAAAWTCEAESGSGTGAGAGTSRKEAEDHALGYCAANSARFAMCRIIQCRRGRRG
jgi:hypothetical protein